MKFTDLLGLFGGIALFLYGMQMMSSGLEAAAGNRMKRILERLTANRFLGVLVGAGITAVIQSSAATTMMVVGFVNSGMMTLKQAVGIIMGANIGTTITGQLVALDVGALAPIFAFAGVVLIVFLKKPSVHHYGQIIAGLGILFIGLNMMSSSMAPLQQSETFVHLLSTFQNPLVGILAGMVFTAIVQSSSATVGVLQALAVSGVIGLPSAVYVLFGQNIGTCVTAMLASAGSNRNAKRATLLHLFFNVIGTVIFTIVCMTTPLTSFVESWTPDNPAAQIANMHTLFNVATTLVLFPFGNLLAQLAKKILPDKAQDEDKTPHLLYLQPLDSTRELSIGLSAIALNGVRRELERMADMTRENVDRSFLAVLDGNKKRLPDVEEREEYIDFLNKEISRYISDMIAYEVNESDSVQVSAFFKISGNLERIGDHAVNICEYTKMMEDNRMHFSESAQEEIREMRRVSGYALSLIHHLDRIDDSRFAKIAAVEQQIDDMVDLYRKNQMRRMHKGSCSDQACVIYSELLTDFERIGDHILNIGEAISTVHPMKSI